MTQLLQNTTLHVGSQRFRLRRFDRRNLVIERLTGDGGQTGRDGWTVESYHSSGASLARKLANLALFEAVTEVVTGGDLADQTRQLVRVLDRIEAQVRRQTERLGNGKK